MTVTAKQLYRAAKLRQRIDRLTQYLEAILGSDDATFAAHSSEPKPGRRFSKSARARMAAAAKARWAAAKAAGRTTLARPRKGKR